MTSNLIAFAALLVSIISFIKSNKFELYKEEKRQREVAEQNMHDKNNNRVPLIPYFHLSFNKEIYTKQIGNE
ncbi:hypothetical protein [Bacillus altitudinis]|uniref:hypothetical protein n=1 Tax=Bacillus altitudinis TaxID=293387 RepID=UPI002DB852CA|nr:hypothetical protein [Bacillus altitudinis]MEC0969377.1 hypothetical protein [Bacillus altitudinis]MEC1001937.1 hypothetical protein [Bacillus altitudinis]